MYANHDSRRQDGQRYAWIGYATGIACMAALFITGLAMGKPQLTVMASSMAALLGAVWASASAAARRSPARRPVERTGA